MKKRILFFTVATGLFYLSLSSYMTGPTFKAQNINCTGGPGSNSSCSGTGCHNDGTANGGSAIFRVRKKTLGLNSAPVNSYQNDSAYYVTVLVKHPSLQGFGFAAEIVNNAGISAGVITTSGILNADSIAGQYVAFHNSTVMLTDSATFEWTAPASDSGDIRMFGQVAIVNNDGNYTGDSTKTVTTATLTWDPGPQANIKEIGTDNILARAYPNPLTGNHLTLSLSNAKAGGYTFTAYHINGQKVYEKNAILSAGKSDIKINTEQWAAGIYVLHIHNGIAQKMITVVKQ